MKQIAVGGGVLLALTVMVCGLMLGWRYLPGLLGEWVGLMVGLVTTPVLLEVFFVIIGLTVVVAINHWRRVREGDELVYLEPVEGPHFEPTLLVQARAGVAAGDLETAASLVNGMPRDELGDPEVLALRLAMAKAEGDGTLVAKLEVELDLLKTESN